MRMILESLTLDTTLKVLKDRVADFQAQAGPAASTDFPPGQ